MTQWVYEALWEHMHVLNHLGIKIAGPVIYNRLNPGQPTDPESSGDLRNFLVYAKILNTADSDGTWEWRALRRFYISARFALGHNEVAIREAVAHWSLDVTFKHYAKALPEPPPIWRYRFRPAEPSSDTKVIDGHGAAVAVDGMAQLPAPDLEGSDNAPAWAIEARQRLEEGWKFGEVVAHVSKSRSAILRAFKAAGWPPPIRVYLDALYRQFEQLLVQ